MRVHGHWSRTEPQRAIWVLDTLRPRQNGRCFADDTFKRISLNENARIAIKISLKFVPKSPIDNNPALVQIMAWRRPGDKPLSEPMMVRLPTHICATRPQWVNCTDVLFGSKTRASLGHMISTAVSASQYYHHYIQVSDFFFHSMDK